jgi:glucose dehydrogenase
LTADELSEAISAIGRAYTRHNKQAICGARRISYLFAGLWAATRWHRPKQRGNAMMRTLGCTLALIFLGSAAFAQSAEELIPPNPKQVTNYGLGYGLQRYSSLSGINRENVAKLAPVWAYQMGTTRG